MSEFDEKVWVKPASVRKRYDVSDASLYRWEKNPEIAFPKAVRINGSRFWNLRELDDFDRRQMASRHFVEAAE